MTDTVLCVSMACLCAGSAVAQQPQLRPTQSTSSQQNPAEATSPTEEPRRQDSRFGEPDPVRLRASASGPDVLGGQPAEQSADYDRGSTFGGASNTDLRAQDRLEPRERDLRLQKDRDAFADPPAGHNPRLFQIEQINPVRDRRTQQFFEADPFEHIGWRLGTFVIFQEFQISPMWNSNVFFGGDARSDWNADLRSETRIVSDWARHALELRMLHDRSYYLQFDSENDAEQTYELRGRLDVTSRTTAEAVVAREIRQESRNSVDAGGVIGDSRPDVVTDRVNVALNHRFNRLSLQLRGGQSETRFEDQTALVGDGRDVRTRTLAARAQWEFRPTFSVFGEFAYDQRRHAGFAASDGLKRDSDGERYRAGVALGQTGEYLRGEASVGYGVQRPKAALPDIEAFLVDANVAWRITPLTSVLFEARTAINETTLAGASGVVDRSVGATLRHSFTHRLIGEAGVTYSAQDYQGAALDEQSVTLNSNVEYSFNRHVALFTQLTHVRFRSSDEARDYDASTVRLGVRLRN